MVRASGDVTMAALRTARAACMVRVAQLSGCRVCGADQQRFLEAVAVLDALLAQPAGVAALLATQAPHRAAPAAPQAPNGAGAGTTPPAPA